MALRLRRGTDLERIGVVFAEGELVYSTDTKRLFIGDGVTAGGVPVSDIISDQSPQLGASLDLNTYDIVGFGNINVNGDITATGTLTVPNIITDVQGSIFGDDSSPLVDGVNSRLVLENNILADIGNVSVFPPVSGNFLKYANNQWQPFEVVLNDIDRVNITDPSANDLFIYDGSNWINSPLTGDFIGNVTGDVTGNLTGDVIGDIVGSVYSTDGSTLLLDAFTNTFIGDARLDTVTISTGLVCEAEVPGEFNANLVGNDDNSVIRLSRKFVSTLETDITRLGIIKFSSVDVTNNQTTHGQIDGRKGYIWLSSSLAANYVDTTNTAHLFLDGSNGCIGVGKRSASFKLDVDGEIVSTSYIQFGNLTTTERNNLTALNGMVIYNTTNNKFEGYQNGAWINIDDGQPAT